MFENFGLTTKIHTVLDLRWGILDNARALAKARNYHALSIRLQGDATIRYKKGNLTIRENDIFFVPKNTSYHLTTRSDEHVICIHFDMPTLNAPPTVFTPVNPSILLELFNQLNETWTKKETGYPYKAHALFNQILFTIAQQQNEAKRNLNPSLKILTNNIVTYIKENFTSSNLRIADVANSFFISETYLRRLFKKYLDCSPIEYLVNLRIKYATELLKSGYYSVKEVAEKCGIDNVKYFSILYKKKTGISPSKIFVANQKY